MARYHAIMTNVAKTLSASDIENLAAYGQLELQIIRII
jgi:cytochrome c553